MIKVGDRVLLKMRETEELVEAVVKNVVKPGHPLASGGFVIAYAESIGYYFHRPYREIGKTIFLQRKSNGGTA